MSPQAKVGLLIMGVVAAVAVVVVNLGDVPVFRSGIRFHIIFDDVSDLPHRALVKMSGVDIGRVSGVDLYRGQARVDVWVDSGYPVRSDTRARILRMGLVGNTYLNLTMGSPDAPLIADGDTIIGESPIDYEVLVEDLVSAAAEGIQAVVSVIGEIDLPEDLAGEITRTLGGMRSVVAGIERAIGRDGENLASVIGGLNSRIDELEPELEKIGEAADAAASAVSGLEDILAMIREGRGAAGKLIVSEDVEMQVRETIENIHSASRGVNLALERYGGFRTSVTAKTYYDTPGGHFSSAAGLTLIAPRSGRYFSAGVENIVPEGETPLPDRRNALTLLAGKNLGDFSVFGGAIRSTGGAGADFRWRDFLEFEAEVFDFTRSRPWLNFNTRLSLTGFLKLGVSYEDILDEGRLRGGLEVEIR